MSTWCGGRDLPVPKRRRGAGRMVPALQDRCSQEGNTLEEQGPGLVVGQHAPLLNALLAAGAAPSPPLIPPRRPHRCVSIHPLSHATRIAHNRRCMFISSVMGSVVGRHISVCCRDSVWGLCPLHPADSMEILSPAAREETMRESHPDGLKRLVFMVRPAPAVCCLSVHVSAKRHHRINYRALFVLSTSNAYPSPSS